MITCQGALWCGAHVLLPGAPVRLADCRISASEDDHPGDHHGGTGDTEDSQQDLFQSCPPLQPALSHQDGLSSTIIQAVRQVDKYFANSPDHQPTQKKIFNLPVSPLHGRPWVVESSSSTDPTTDCLLLDYFLIPVKIKII